MMKRVLVTGACGNIGREVVTMLLARGYAVRALDLGTPQNRRLASQWTGGVNTPNGPPRLELAFGSVCDESLVARAVAETDHVIHLAAMIPPGTDRDQFASYAVNVAATRSLHRASAAQPRPPRFTFTSSAGVFGDNANYSGPRKSDEPVVPSCNYTRQKVECERFIAAGDVPYAIFRPAMTPPLTPSSLDSFVFEMAADTRVEFTHPRDLALGLVNSLVVDEVEGKAWGLGGGAENRYRYREWLNATLASMGIGPMPESAFGVDTYLTDWVDSESSHALLDYQRHSFDDYLSEIAAAMGPARHLVRAVSPVAGAYVLANSRYHAESRGRRPILPEAERALTFLERGLRAARAYVPS